MAVINVVFKETYYKSCIVTAREALHYYPILFHGQQNEFMEIVKDQYMSEFSKLIPAGRAVPEIDDETLAHIVSKLHPALAGNASVPWRIIQHVSESPAGKDIERFLKKNGLIHAHSAQKEKVSFGMIFIRKKLEKKKYDLNRVGVVTKKHVELNPHMTLKFAIEHCHATWDWQRFGANTNFTWADFESFMQARQDIFEPVRRSAQDLARGYLAKNCNLTVDEFRKIKILLYLNSDLLMGYCARNPFVWHPTLYKQRISAARTERRCQLREFMRESVPLSITVTVLRYCDCR